MSAVEDRYRAFTQVTTDMVDFLAYFVDLVVTNDYRTVIELGVRGGVSAAAWLYGLEQTGGHLWAVDVDPCPYLADHMTFIRGNDCAPAVLAQLPDHADIVFVDTDHTFDQTCSEIDFYLPRVNPGGYMLFHDVDVPHPNYQVRAALDEKFGPEQWENRKGGPGLGIWRVPDAT